MRNTDERIKSGLSVTPGFLIAAIVGRLAARAAETVTGGDDPAFATLRNQQHTIAVPKRLARSPKKHG